MAFTLKNPTVVEKRRISTRERLAQIESREVQRLKKLSPNLNIMIKAVQKAGASLVHDFREVGELQVSKKGPTDFVSNADINSEKILIDILKQERPDYGFICEESGVIEPQNGSEYTWIIDPLDGTNNYLHAIDIFSVVVALRKNDEIIASVIYNPITRDLYYAEKGNGAFKMSPTGNKRLRVSARTNFAQCLIRIPMKLKQKFPMCSGVRKMGSTTLELCGVAGGQIDIWTGGDEKLWDISAPYLIIKESGGQFMTKDGKTELKDLLKSDCIIASNLTLCEKILTALKK